MTVIVIHAGMPKAGSSSIQKWLEVSSSELREQGFTVAVSPPGGPISFVPHKSGTVTSGWILRGAVGAPAQAQRESAESFVSALASAAGRYGNIVVSSERFAVPFWTVHAPFLVSLERLAARFDVRVAYYVRPQHTALEAAWRQWGYRTASRPSAFLERWASRLHHAATRRGARELAPGVEFEPVPFTEELLASGGLVTDFARRFLEIEAQSGHWQNRGLSLEMVNLLRAAPTGMFWDSEHDNKRLDRIKDLIRSNAFEVDERIAVSRRVLQKYAFERFGTDNAELGWHDFVPPSDNLEPVPGLEALDDLWTPSASPAERELLFSALQAALRVGRVSK